MTQETFLGALNNLTIGFGYERQKLNCGATISGENTNTLCGSVSSLTPKYYTIDANWQQKFGDFVPEVQLGWTEKKNIAEISNDPKVKSEGYYLQLAGLYNQMVGIGKPELAFRRKESSVKNYLYSSNNQYYGDGKISSYSIFINYYIADENAKVTLGADIVNPNDKLKNYYCNITERRNGTSLKDFTDYTLVFQM